MTLERLTLGIYVVWVTPALAVQAPLPPSMKTPSAAQLLEQSTPADWRQLDPANTLYLELPKGRVIIELAPGFAPRHTANIKTLVHARYFDGLSVLRAQDNYVVQWGDPDAEDAAKAKPLGAAEKKLPAEFTRSTAGLEFAPLGDGDVYAPEVGFSGGFAVARDAKRAEAWLLHCYGAVGAARDLAKDSSTGTELYAVIGQSPRHLDRNITLVGRVVAGMELLSTMPRGSGALGFYEKSEQRAPLTTVRLAADVAPSQRTNLEVLRTDRPLFQKYIDARRNRREEWFIDPVGHVEICNVPVPMRPVRAASP